MKKHYIILTLMCLTAGFLYGQSNNKGKKTKSKQDTVLKHDIGLNAIGMFTAIFNSDGSDVITPYLFSYNLDMGKTNFRVGFGPLFSSQTTTNEGFSDSQKETKLRLDARIGVGWDVVDEQRWVIRTGADVIGGYLLDKEVDDTGFDAVTSQEEEWSVGAGPFVQVIFKINDRVSLSTDAALYFRHFNNTQSELFKNFPDFNNQLSETTGQQLDVFIPTSLFIHFHF